MTIYKERKCWNCIARVYNFHDPSSMLKYFYDIKKMTPAQISEILEVGVKTVRARLRFYGITHNGWGGKRQ
jgi:hypothetical protein